MTLICLASSSHSQPHLRHLAFGSSVSFGSTLFSFIMDMTTMTTMVTPSWSSTSSVMESSTLGADEVILESLVQHLSQLLWIDYLGFALQFCFIFLGVFINGLLLWVLNGQSDALWSGTNKNRDVSTGPLALPFARLLTLLTRSLAPDRVLRLRPPLRSLVCSLAHFAHSLACGKVNF